MARRFFYLSMGILELAGAYHLGAARTEAQLAAGSLIHSMDYAGWFLDTSGQVWNTGSPKPDTWTRWPAYDIPIPVGDVRLWGPQSLITWDDVAWAHDGAAWTEVGPFPGGSVSVEAKTFGSVKGQFK